MTRRAWLLAAMSGLAIGTTEAHAQVWQDHTAECLGTTAGWTSKVETGDVDGDGLDDIILANGGDYASAGTPELSRVFRNLGNWDGAAPHCEEITAEVFGTTPGLTRSIKLGDIDGDGDNDIFVAGAWHTRSRLIRRDADGWTDVSSQLPQMDVSAGDAEFADVDDDGDLDLVVADDGALDPGAAGYAGGRVRLWLNDSSGTFTDVTDMTMPTMRIEWSWDIEVVDVTGDSDPDILVSCKLCAGSQLYANNGWGIFTVVPGAIPAATNNYEFEAFDIDGDGDRDLATVNDGPVGRNRILINDGSGGFTDETATRLFGAANPASDDNVVLFIDVDSDGDPDLVTGSLSGRDRLAINNGAGVFTAAPDFATPNDTPGTLGLNLADLNGDGRLDLIQGQGEVTDADKVQLASAAVAVDAVAPRVVIDDENFTRVVTVHIDDGHSSDRSNDYASVVFRSHGGEVPLTRVGQQMWTGAEIGWRRDVEVCATDRSGNTGCDTATLGYSFGDDVLFGSDANTDGNPGDDQGSSGGCCQTGGGASSSCLVALLAGAGLFRRRRRKLAA